MLPSVISRPVLRDYQERDIERIRALIRSGRRRIVRQLSTGGGKTVEASYMIRGAVDRGKRCLFLAHRKELVDQASRKLRDLGIEHGIIMADHPMRRPDLRTHVASVQTLVNREIAEPDVVWVDEAHHAKAKTWHDLLDRWPNAIVIGLTATPVRSDGRGLLGMFTDLVAGPTTPELITAGYLVPTRVFAPSCPDLVGVKKLGGDYNQDQLAQRMNQIIGDLVDHWKRLGEDRQTVVFAVNVEHSKRICESFVAAGVRAEHLDGTTWTEDREGILRRLRVGTTRVVCSVGVLTEGWDEPAVGCAILARPTASLGLFLQMVGRVKRPHPGKPDSILLDHAGCVAKRGRDGWELNHGHPDQEREWLLTEDRKVTKPKLDADPMDIRVCPKCAAVWPPTTEICACGYVFAKRKRAGPEHVDGSLEELLAASLAGLPEAKKKSEWWKWRRTADRRSMKPGWAAYRYKEAFGSWPPREWESEFQRAMQRLGHYEMDEVMR